MSAKNSLQFLDTNILVYAYDNSTGVKHEKAHKLLDELWNSQSACVSIQVLEELYVTLTRKVAAPISSETAAEIIKDLAHFTVHAPGVDDLLDGIIIQQKYKINIWDAMIIQSASASDCTVLWSEDLSAGQDYQGVVVKNPFLA
jgi:predicted nucleic acid-binding protein